MLTASIVICTKDREADLRRCLDSLGTQTRPPDELVVVDSGSDGTEGVVREFGQRLPGCEVQYLRCEPGLTKQRNVGIAAATRDVLHFFDDDIVCEPDYLDEMQKTFEAEGAEDVLSVGPRVKLTYQPSRWVLPFRKLFLLTQVAGSGRLLPSAFGSYTWLAPIDTIHPIEVISGCCCAFRREVFAQIAFDEFFEGYGFMEDLDFTYRASRLGRMVCNPKARITHFESQAARTKMKRLMEMQIVNHCYVFKKHMPSDAFHWWCFWWSEFGEGLRRLALTIRLCNLDVARGMAKGLWTVLRRRVPQGEITGSAMGTEKNGVVSR